MLHQRQEADCQEGSMRKMVETAPNLDLTPQDLDGLLGQVQEYQVLYRPLYQRREQREKSERYLYGLLSPEIKDKAIEPMMLELEGDNQNEIRAMQHFISEGAWDDDAVLARHWQEVAKDLGDEEGVFALDGSDFAKQGDESVGVKRQWCGELGKTANCQAGVFLGYASQKGFALLHRQLYLPEEWVKDEAYAERRRRCGVPKETTFQTKLELGLKMLEAVCQAGTLPGRWLACDEAFGRSTVFLDQVADLGLWYYAEVPHDTCIWLERPATYVPKWSGRGRKPIRLRLVAGTPDPQTVLEVAASLPAAQWTRHTIKEGSKGPLVADFAMLRVVAVRDHLPGPDVWLIFRRALSTGELKVYLSNAPMTTPQCTLIRLSGMRWPIETTFEDGKQLVGMGDYQVRSWIGWHHHMTMCILAHFFLVRLRIRLGDKAPALTLPQVKLLLTGILPKREFDREWVLEVLGYRQRRNHAAYLSHRKRRLDTLSQSEQ
jgi:SRSO17 transposase